MRSACIFIIHYEPRLMNVFYDRRLQKRGWYQSFFYRPLEPETAGRTEPPKASFLNDIWELARIPICHLKKTAPPFPVRTPAQCGTMLLVLSTVGFGHRSI